MTIPYFTIAAVTAIPTAIFLAGVLYKKWARKREERLAAKLVEHSGSIYIKITEVVDELLALTHPQAFKVLDSEKFEPAWILVFPTGMESDLRSQVYENYFRLLECQPLVQPKTTGKQVELATQLNGYGWSNLFSDIKQEVSQLALDMAHTAAAIEIHDGHPDLVDSAVAFIGFWDKEALTLESVELNQLFSALRSHAQKKLEEEAEVASDEFFSQFPEDDEPEDGFVLIQGDEEPSEGAIAEELGEQKLSQKQLVAATLELFATVFPLEQFRTMRLSHDSVKAQMQYNVHRYLAGNPQAIAHPEETISRIAVDYMGLPGCDPRAKAVFIDLLNAAYSQSQVIAATTPDEPAFPFDVWISGEVFAGHQFNSLADDLDITRYIWKNLKSSSASCAILASSLDPVLMLANAKKRVPDLFSLSSSEDVMDAVYSGFGNHNDVWKEMAAITPPTPAQFLDVLRTDRFFLTPFGGEVTATREAISDLTLISPEWAKFVGSVYNLLVVSMTKLFGEFEATGEGLSFSLYELLIAMQSELDEQDARSQPVKTEEHQEEQPDHPAIATIELIFHEDKIMGSPDLLLECKQAGMETFLYRASDFHDGYAASQDAQGNLVIEVDVPQPNLSEFFRLMYQDQDISSDDYDEFVTVRVILGGQYIEMTLPEAREHFCKTQQSEPILKVQFRVCEGQKPSASLIHKRNEILVDVGAVIQEKYPKVNLHGLDYDYVEDEGVAYFWFCIPKPEITNFLNQLHLELPHLDECIVARVFEDDPLGIGGTLPELREFFR